jgi:hypothetical protein
MHPPARFEIRNLRWVLYLFTGAALIILPARGQGIRFIQEEITIAVTDTVCTVHGDYHFWNPSSQPVDDFALVYPFPVSPEMLFPDSIIVTDRRTGQAVPYKHDDNSIAFRINVPSAEEVVYTVSYRQPVRARRFEYIMLTTRHWQHPLTLAEFEVHIPREWRLQYLSPDYDLLQETATERVYTICREDFLPDTNLIIQWEPTDHD